MKITLIIILKNLPADLTFIFDVLSESRIDFVLFFVILADIDIF